MEHTAQTRTLAAEATFIELAHHTDGTDSITFSRYVDVKANGAWGEDATSARQAVTFPTRTSTYTFPNHWDRTAMWTFPLPDTFRQLLALLPIGTVIEFNRQVSLPKDVNIQVWTLAIRATHTKAGKTHELFSGEIAKHLAPQSETTGAYPFWCPGCMGEPALAEETTTAAAA